MSDSEEEEERLPIQPGVFHVWWEEQFGEMGRRQVGGVYKILEDCKTMLKAHSHGEFGDMVDVPEGAWCVELSERGRKYFVDPPCPRPEFKEGLEIEEWKDHVRDECLTIQDLQDLKLHEKIEVLVMDRNLCDVVCDDTNNACNTLHDPEVFFRHNKATYAHHSGLQGQLIYHWVGGDSEPYDFEFEIEYKKDCWYPLKDGCLPPQDPQGFATFKYDGFKHWTTFPPTTRIGWRGPMLLWRKVVGIPNGLPKVWWYNSTA